MQGGGARSVWVLVAELEGNRRRMRRFDGWWRWVIPMEMVENSDGVGR